MDSFWSELIKAAPTIAPVIAVVMLFLRYLKDSRKEDREAIAVIMQTVLKTHIEQGTLSREALTECSTSLKQNTTALGKNSWLLDKLSSKGAN